METGEGKCNLYVCITMLVTEGLTIFCVPENAAIVSWFLSSSTLEWKCERQEKGTAVAAPNRHGPELFILIAKLSEGLTILVHVCLEL